MLQVLRLKLLLQFVAGLTAIYGLSLLLSQAKEAVIVAQLPDGWSILRPPHEVSALLLDGDHLWAGGRDGLFLIERRTSELLPLPKGAPPLSFVTDLLRDRESALWIASREGAFRFSDGTWTKLGTGDGAPEGPAKSLLEDSAGDLWIGYETGVLQRGKNGSHFYDSSSGLGIHSVDVILEDRSGGLWFGSASPTEGGLSHFDGDSWTLISTGGRLPHRTVNALLEDRQGSLWVGTGFSRRGGAGRFAAGTWTQLGIADGLAGEKVRSFFEDSRGRLWIGSEYDGIAVFDGKERQVLTPAQGLAGWEVKEMVEDFDGVLWMGTEDGISRIDGLSRVASMNGASR